MSEENLALVRRLHDAWNEEDETTMLELLDEEFEYVNPSYAVEGGVRVGRAGFSEVLENLRRSFESYRHDPEELIDYGEHVVVRSRFSARGRGSGLRVERPRVHAWTLRDGRVVRLRWFDTVEEAKDALGVSE